MIELSCINALKLLNMVHGSIQSPDRLLAIRPIWSSQSLNGALELFEEQSRGLSVLCNLILDYHILCSQPEIGMFVLNIIFKDLCKPKSMHAGRI